MFTKERIREIRNLLGLTQEDMGTVLGVTKTTVARYEMGIAKPVGDAEKKFAQLDDAVVDPEQKQRLEGLLKDRKGGISVLAGMLAMGAALLPVGAIVAGGVGFNAIMSGKVGKTMYDFLAKYHGKKDQENQ